MAWRRKRSERSTKTAINPPTKAQRRTGSGSGDSDEGDDEGFHGWRVDRSDGWVFGGREPPSVATRHLPPRSGGRVEGCFALSCGVGGEGCFAVGGIGVRRGWVLGLGLGAVHGEIPAASAGMTEFFSAGVTERSAGVDGRRTPLCHFVTSPPAERGERELWLVAGDVGAFEGAGDEEDGSFADVGGSVSDSFEVV